jgi:ABC-type nitrate/sulfonate/bicarbonate transport system permease component
VATVTLIDVANGLGFSVVIGLVLGVAVCLYAEWRN